jgi:starch phosphorylase
VRAITNGVHVPTWAHESFARLFQGHFPQWGHEPEVLVLADQLPEADVWSAHERAKAGLLRLVRETTGVEMRPEVPLIGLARRMTGYKRPELLFTDIGRLERIARAHPFQVVLAGKAHPRDGVGKDLIERLHRTARDLAGIVPVAFLPNYDMAVARAMVAGADVWLNTPLPPLEASGTSGMKAAVNGGLNLSVLDGWWVEACIEGVTGWAIGPDGAVADRHAAELYDKLERVVLPLYDGDRPRWIWMMKQAIAKIASRFNSQTMMRRYASEAYLR